VHRKVLPWSGHDVTIERPVAHRAGAQTKPDATCETVLLRDRTNQVIGYAIAVGLFGAAGVFLIAACLVGVTALFRWIEVNYGRPDNYRRDGLRFSVLIENVPAVTMAHWRQRTHPRLQ
jgi:hypothetical protein